MNFKVHKINLISFFLVCFTWIASAQKPPVKITPRSYICYRASEPLRLDGLLNEPDWQAAAWSESFCDIEGCDKTAPPFNTQVKLLWDDTYLYIAANLSEPNIWANLTQRESIIFFDNDFEIFIDPDSDTHNYLELEINALNTQWDLLVLKPYRDDTLHNVAIDNWNINGLISAVHCDGTINNPSDTDKGWTLEIAIPLDAIIELSSNALPVAGEQYRIGFSRVEWETEVVEGKYVKKSQLVNGVKKQLPEHNWVWSPQGVIAMHQPETWGYLQFSGLVAGKGSDVFISVADQRIKEFLRDVYFAENAYMQSNSKYAGTTDLAAFEPALSAYGDFQLEICITPTGWEATVPSTSTGNQWHIRKDGWLWKTSSNTSDKN